MRNLKNLDEDGNDHAYWPNELAELRRTNPNLYHEVVQSNLEEDDTVEQWEQRNLKRAQEDLAEQRRKHK